MNRNANLILTVLIIGVMTIISIVHEKINSDIIIDEVRNNKYIDLENKIKDITDKKNTLMLICLEQKKKRPNKQLLDSLEVSYYLD